MKRATALLASVILLVSMLVLGVGSTTQAQARCSLASFRGAYGILVTGFFQQQGGPPVASNPYAAVGLVTADGVGGFSGTITESSNGNIQSNTFTGTYAVNPDCTGSLFVPGPHGGTVNLVIVARGSQLLFFGTEPGSVQSGIGIKQGESRCSLSSFQGTYGIRATGFFQPDGTVFASYPSAAVGTLTADGMGGVSGIIAESDNGTIQSFTLAGTYTVNPDCTGSLLVPGPYGVTANFVIVARGSQALLITTLPERVQTAVLVLVAPAVLQISAFTTIDVPGSIETGISGINNGGQISGNFADSSGREHGFVLSGGNFTTVDVPGSTATSGRGINDRGQSVGVYFDNTGRRHGYLLSGGNFTTIDFPGAAETRAIGINNPGAIVGRYMDTGGIIHGFLFAGSFTTIDVPGATRTIALGINDRGEVVGRYRDSAGIHGFLLGSGGVFSSFDFPEATFTEGVGINNRGEIVGDYEDAAGMTHGFLLSGGTFRTMDVPGAIETDPAGINDVGQIVGSYADSTGKFHGFLIQR